MFRWRFFIFGCRRGESLSTSWSAFPATICFVAAAGARLKLSGVRPTLVHTDSCFGSQKMADWVSLLVTVVTGVFSSFESMMDEGGRRWGAEDDARC